MGNVRKISGGRRIEAGISLVEFRVGAVRDSMGSSGFEGFGGL